MQDKDMVNDVLTSVNSSITGYAGVITHASNPDFRSTIQKIRDSDETFQFSLYKLAEQKGFYKPAQQANPTDINDIKGQFSN